MQMDEMGVLEDNHSDWAFQRQAAVSPAHPPPQPLPHILLALSSPIPWLLDKPDLL